VAPEPAGLVGVVRDTAGEPVAGATVYLVASTAIPTAALDLSSIAAARASTDDEPLEDAIAAQGASFAQAVTDANGVYRIAAVAPGRYYVTAIPASADKARLPGGDKCRVSMQHTALVGKQVDIKLSTQPSAAAEYVGPSVCLTCHGATHQKQTLHALGIRVVGKTGPLQRSDRFPKWNDPLATKFTEAGTTLYFFGFNGNTASPDWKVSETNPGAGVSFTARLYSTGSGDAKAYFVDLSDVKGTSGTKTYQVELSYGGGLYKQRYMTKLADGSRYVLPIQFNTQAADGLAGDETTAPYGRWVWVQYNAQNWYAEDTTTPASSHLKEPAVEKSFDNACAGCHFTGYSIDPNKASPKFNKASGVPDANGEYDYDGDGQPEMMNLTCESCHGPGSEHWYGAGKGKAIVSPSLLTPEREVTICAQCHTRAIGAGGVLNASSAANSEAPLGADARMPRPGISRAEFLASYVSKIDDGLWANTDGDGKHSKKHHQQASDFIKSGKYRNPYDLITCSSCHDLHGNSAQPHQLKGALDDGTTAGLCLSCHGPYFPAAGSNPELRMRAHWAEQGIANVSMGNAQCVDCHMPKTAKSGSGLKQLTIGATTYYSGDISSHMFDVPMRASIAQKGSGMMAIPFTNACALCHVALTP
jgi:predicted CXXCH cytochrome family protein